MHSSGPNPPGDALGDAELIDFRAIAAIVRTCARAVSRRRKVVLAIAGCVVALAALGLAVLGKTYHVETRLLVGRNQVLAIRGDSPDADPSRAAAELILRQDSLVDLMKATHFLEEWPKRRAPLLRLKDIIMSYIQRDQSEAEKLNGYLGFLRTRLNVWKNEGTVTIQIDWPDPVMAFRLVDAAQRAFLEARHVQDVSTIAEASAILEGHASDAQHEVDESVAQLKTLLDRKRNEKDTSAKKAIAGAETAAAAAASAAPHAPAAPAPPSAESIMDSAKNERRLSELGVMIEAKARTIRDLEDFRQRRLAELNTQLDEKRAVYTEAHPAISDIKQAISGVSHESPQVSHLREEVTALENERDSLRGKDAAAKPHGSGGGGGGALARNPLSGDVIRIEQESAEERDPEVEYARARLQFAIQNYQQLQGKIDAARVDLETAEAAFKYRYTVIEPPEVPRGPIKPKPPLVMIGALIGGLFIGMLTAIIMDLRRGVLEDRFQVEQSLALPVLGEVHLLPANTEKKS